MMTVAQMWEDFTWQLAAFGAHDEATMQAMKASFYAGASSIHEAIMDDAPGRSLGQEAEYLVSLGDELDAYAAECREQTAKMLRAAQTVASASRRAN